MLLEICAEILPSHILTRYNGLRVPAFGVEPFKAYWLRDAPTV